MAGAAFFIVLILRDVGQPFHKARKKLARTAGFARSFNSSITFNMRAVAIPEGIENCHLNIFSLQKRSRSILDTHLGDKSLDDCRSTRSAAGVRDPFVVTK